MSTKAASKPSTPPVKTATKTATKTARKGTGTPANRMLNTRLVPADPSIVTQLFASAGTAPTAPEGNIRGYEGQFYYGVSTAAEAIFANVVSFDIDVKGDSIDATDRATVGWKDKLTGLKEWTATVKANAIQSGTDLQTLFSALTGGTTLTGTFRPQDVSGGIAYFGTFVITSYKHSSPENGLQTIDCTLEGRGALVLGSVTTGGAAAA